MRHLLREIDARELTELEELYTVEPWGEVRADLRAGIVAASNANLWQDKGGRMLTPLDFMPFVKVHRRQTTEDIRRRLELIAKIKQGRALTNGKHR